MFQTHNNNENRRNETDKSTVNWLYTMHALLYSYTRLYHIQSTGLGINIRHVEFLSFLRLLLLSFLACQNHIRAKVPELFQLEESIIGFFSSLTCLIYAMKCYIWQIKATQSNAIGVSRGRLMKQMDGLYTSCSVHKQAFFFGYVLRKEEN